ncbi:MAG: hypothetical protein F6K30_10975 [Cyanothece sp. SIO2G6]|nr:hypothetical protein [Cyanothece sp. SIO2G6]
MRSDTPFKVALRDRSPPAVAAGSWRGFAPPQIAHHFIRREPITGFMQREQ